MTGCRIFSRCHDLQSLPRSKPLSYCVAILGVALLSVVVLGLCGDWSTHDHPKKMLRKSQMVEGPEDPSARKKAHTRMVLPHALATNRSPPVAHAQLPTIHGHAVLTRAHRGAHATSPFKPTSERGSQVPTGEIDRCCGSSSVYPGSYWRAWLPGMRWCSEDEFQKFCLREPPYSRSCQRNTFSWPGCAKQFCSAFNRSSGHCATTSAAVCSTCRKCFARGCPYSDTK